MRSLLLIFFSLVSWLCCVDSSPSPSTPSFCPRSELVLPVPGSRFLDQCPFASKPSPSLEVSGDFIDKVLTSKWSNRHVSVLFYASWCPFSRSARLAFDALSYMYPQIEHFSVEQSVTLPIVYSRYGIHSLPALLVLNETSLTRFHGTKDMTSFVQFYKETTGLEATEHVAFDHSDSLRTSGDIIMQSWVGASMDEIQRREPYLLFCVLFLLVRLVIYLLPRILDLSRAVWASYQPHLNLEIFGEARQMLGRILHVIDVKRLLNKLKLSKCRNLRQGASNARVWASSLASVSLGKTSSSRFAS